jgi:hypothetical protein
MSTGMSALSFRSNFWWGGEGGWSGVEASTRGVSDHEVTAILVKKMIFSSSLPDNKEV